MLERHLHIRFPKPKMATVIGFAILIIMFFFGLIVIKKVNKEYDIRMLAGRFQQYKYATLSFSNIYSGLPGDITNADFYWKDVTVNGNGNGKIDPSTNEGIAAWQQLQLAKLLEFPYQLTGKWNEEKGEGILVPGINAPGIEGKNAGYFLTYSDKLESNVFGLARFEEKTDEKHNPLHKPFLTPDDAYTLDLMIDDGYPDRGNLVSVSDSSSGCSAVGEYKKESEREECIPLFKF